MTEIISASAATRVAEYSEGGAGTEKKKKKSLVLTMNNVSRTTVSTFQLK